MENKLEYSFDDEPVSKFCYDMDNKKIEVYFTAYYDLREGENYIELPCVLIIENWEDSKSRIDGEKKFDSLEKHFGIFSMILFMEKKGDDLELYVNTVDNRYMTLLFMKPQISLMSPCPAAHIPPLWVFPSLAVV